MSLERATSNGRGFSIFPESWGIPPVTDRSAPEFAEWVRNSVLVHEMRGPAAELKLGQLQEQRRRLLHELRVAELEAKRESP